MGAQYPGSGPMRGQGIVSSLVREPKVVTVPLFHYRRTPQSRGGENIVKLSIYNLHHRSHFKGYDSDVMILELST